nr:MAG TPA: antimicrobial peptide 2 precursor [Caudoviricetes sp.]
MLTSLCRKNRCMAAQPMYPRVFIFQKNMV